MTLITSVEVLIPHVPSHVGSVTGRAILLFNLPSSVIPSTLLPFFNTNMDAWSAKRTLLTFWMFFGVLIVAHDCRAWFRVPMRAAGWKDSTIGEEFLGLNGKRQAL